jgi:hypothetical protein
MTSQESLKDLLAIKPIHLNYSKNLFSLKMSNTFYKTMASFFIGACIFDWNHLRILLDRFQGALMWS